MLGTFAPDHVLDRTAHPTGNIQFWCDPRARLADLINVRPPAHAGDGARATYGSAKQAGELFQHLKPLRASYATTTADHDPRVAE